MDVIKSGLGELFQVADSVNITIDFKNHFSSTKVGMKVLGSGLVELSPMVNLVNVDINLKSILDQWRKLWMS